MKREKERMSGSDKEKESKMGDIEFKNEGQIERKVGKGEG